MRPGRTVADAMLRHPTVHPTDLTLAEARAAFEASAKTHMLLFVEEERLVGTLTRVDLMDPLPPGARVPTGLLADRVIEPDAPLDATWEQMAREGRRRLAVADSSMRLLGLLCLKRRLDGFCTDEGVAHMREDRRR